MQRPVTTKQYDECVAMTDKASNSVVSDNSEGGDVEVKFWSSRNIGVLALSGVIILTLIIGAFAFQEMRFKHTAANALIRPSGLPTSISTSLANLMALSPIPNTAAHDFTLTDQRGVTTSLRSFRGRAVVLDFMDPHCVDICPIVSQELLDAHRNLGASANRVVFLAVNVNQFATSVGAVNAFSREHQLTSLPSWHFFTGSAAMLRSVWRAYGVAVNAPSPQADVVHSSLIFFIDAKGRERYLANPTDLRTATGKAYLPADSLASWGTGIALVLKSLLS
jgi:cytochrome oxidase Cu insertion factor (SCO1/SenC/PrrC family)